MLKPKAVEIKVGSSEGQNWNIGDDNIEIALCSTICLGQQNKR